MSASPTHVRTALPVMTKRTDSRVFAKPDMMASLVKMVGMLHVYNAMNDVL